MAFNPFLILKFPPELLLKEIYEIFSEPAMQAMFDGYIMNSTDEVKEMAEKISIRH